VKGDDKLILEKYGKYSEYEYIEQKFLPLQDPFHSGQVAQNQRCYFTENPKLIGKRIVAIDILASQELTGDIMYGDFAIVNWTTLAAFTLTILNEDGEEQLKDYPLHDLGSYQFNQGKTRIFDIIHDLTASYVKNTRAQIVVPNIGILFNFYTVNW
jgi:hypothetical protein